MARHGENIRKRTDGRWEARYIERYENGKAKYRYVYAKSYIEVKNKRAIMMKEALPKTKLFRSDETLTNLSKLWLESVRIFVKESTYTRYVRNIEKYILPRIGKLPMYKLDVVMLGSFTDSLLINGGTNGGKLSAKTVSDILSVLKSCLQYGKEKGYPCPDLSLIKQPKIKNKEIVTITGSNKQNLERLLWSSGDRVCSGVLLSLYTGLRIGELCALKWSDINFQDATLTVSRTVERIAKTNALSDKKTKLVIGEPKTPASYRVIPLPEFLLDHLKQYRSESNLYVLSGKSIPTEPHTFYVCYKRFMKRNNIGNYTFHALRHTFATTCVELGFDPKSLSEILGHSNVATTMRCYVHPTMQSKRNQMERLMPLGISGQKDGLNT